MHFEPVLRNEETIAVLVVGWDARSTASAGSRRRCACSPPRPRWRSSAPSCSRSLEESARTDDLTGLLNRRAWEEELPREMARARRSSDPLCVAMLDLDFFKAYNDERGHQAGDRLLKQSAAAWVTELRASDMLARYGGEEFTVVLPGATSPTRRRSSSGSARRCRAIRPSPRASPAGTGASRRRSSSAAPMRRSTRRSARAATGS